MPRRSQKQFATRHAAQVYAKQLQRAKVRRWRRTVAKAPTLAQLKGPWSYTTLSEASGLSRRTVQRVMHKETKSPAARTIHTLAMVLGCHPSDLLNYLQAPA